VKKSWEESVDNMQIAEIICEDIDGNDMISNVVAAIDLIRNRIEKDGLPAKVPMQVVVRYIQNTGLPEFTYEDLILANEESPAISNSIKNISPDFVTFSVNDSSSDSVSNSSGATRAVDNPQQTVSNMAKSAMRRRQK
jgi:hypothetical protein